MNAVHKSSTTLDDEPPRFTAISLFCSGGIGDLAARNVGMEHLVANELLDDRCEVFNANYPTTTLIRGDIWDKQEEIIEATRQRLAGRTLDFAIATPPCQGMSSNGMGKLLQGVRSGKKPRQDERNRLIIPTMNVITALMPRVVCLENVPKMDSTIILSEEGQMVRILDYVRRRLGPDYVGRAEVVEFADYGVPEMRQRLITVFTRDPIMKEFFVKEGTFLPARTHGPESPDRRPYRTVNETIGGFPPLDAADKRHATSDIPFHRVPVLDKDKYFWVSNTPPGCGAMDNQCVRCGFKGNPTHGSIRIDGVNKTRKDTPVRCLRCGELLPRPWVVEDGEYRLMSAFTSAYRRMEGDKPASALTCNLSYACSDHKLHPTQHRVLSLYEAFHIHTISDFHYTWSRSDGRKIADATVRDIIGESIPPRGLLAIYRHLTAILSGQKVSTKAVQTEFNF